MDSTEWSEIQKAMEGKTCEYCKIKKHCDDECSEVKFKLKKLERIQNKHFFKRYYNRLKQCTKKYKEYENVEIEKFNLFHSTGKTNPKLILTGVEGMDRNFASDSNFFGPGIYFAIWMDYSHFNSRKMFCHRVEGENNEYQIIIARAVVGRSKRLKMNKEGKKDKNMEKEVLRNDIGVPLDKNKVPYESIQDYFKEGPIMYVLLENEQVYPDYLATYEEDPPRQW